MSRLFSRPDRADRGAAAVEFALVLPLLLLMLFGLIDFGRALNAQITLTQSAREGVRLAALQQPGVEDRTRAAAEPMTGVTVSVTACPANPAPTDDAVVLAQQDFTFITPIDSIADLFGGGLGSSFQLTGKGVMRCLG
ncbi:TadE/TadG family type IV pilus assembly protein [Nocardioides sp. NPDC051685]|uniref:TadE/TadG family type IV pilus assembly protein n=1 Tax=Nocardioides sp. NPDC051685 TaxID=3364334 RepID=UPI0037924C8C